MPEGIVRYTVSGLDDRDILARTTSVKSTVHNCCTNGVIQGNRASIGRKSRREGSGNEIPTYVYLSRTKL